MTMLSLPLFAYADGFISLVGIPGLQTGSMDMSKFIENAMRMLIIAAALIAVIKIILAGAQYVLSGIVTDKEKAKKDIRSALIGLLIILGGVSILTTINPNLTNLPALTPAGDLIPWEDILPEDPEQDDIDIICDPANGGCSIKNCDEILPTTLGIIVSAGGLPIITNSITCSVWCPWFGGIRQNRTPLIPDSGRCIYPNDQDAVAEARERAREEFANQGVEAKVVTFTDPSDLDLSDTDEADLYYDIENAINSIPSSLRINDIDDIYGIFDLNQSELDEIYLGTSDRSEYESVMTRIIQNTCEGSGGTRIYPMSIAAISGGGTRYFCI